MGTGFIGHTKTLIIVKQKKVRPFQAPPQEPCPIQRMGFVFYRSLARQDQVKIQVHHLQAEAINGNARLMAFFYSFKKVQDNGYIKDWKKLDLSLIKFKISRPTYFKYIKKLIGLGYITEYKGSLQLIGQNTISKLYPIEKKKLKLTYLRNGANLHEEIQKASNYYNVRSQQGAIKTQQHYNVNSGSRKVFKIVNGVGKVYIAQNNEISLSQNETARLMGKRSRTTALKHQKKWKQDGTFFIHNRKVPAHYTSYHAGEYGVFKKGTYILRQLANEFEIRDCNFGKKEKFRTTERPLVECWATSDLTMEHF